MKGALILLLCVTYVSAQLPNVTLPTVTVPTVTVPNLPLVGGLLASASSILSGLARTSYQSLDSDEEEDYSDTASIITGFKYPVEEYSVSTDDGYIIKIFRIPCSKSNNPKHPNSVLIMPDYYTSSDYWVLSGPKYGLPYYLANLGYDVWLGNNRGGKYGQRHKILNKVDPAFWYYSIHEWGIYDLPAIIDFIIDHNKCEKISYIGWGYGATEFFVMASEKPEYVYKVRNMQGLGPHVFLDYTRSRIKLASLNIEEESIYEVAGRDALIPNEVTLNIAGRTQCLKEAKNKKVCDYLEPVAHEGFNIDIPGFPEKACNPPIQGGMRFFLHIIQSMKKGFRQYDSGLASNLLYYGQKCPPKYDIKAADLPIALYSSDDDDISVSKDVEHLSIVVPKLIRSFKIKEKNFGFVDFPLSKVGVNCYYPWVVQVLERYFNY